MLEAVREADVLDEVGRRRQAGLVAAVVEDGNVITSRGANVDVVGLPGLLEANPAYIGVIGSRRRWLTTVKGLKQQGVAEEKIARVHSPMGLELNAETPEEIAVSILAEVLMLKDKGTGKPMKLKQAEPQSETSVAEP